MKKLKGIISAVLCLALLLSIAPFAGATENDEVQTNVPMFAEQLVEQLAEYDEVQVAQNAYNSLSPAAKAIFNQMLAIDTNTRNYHIANVGGYVPASPVGITTFSASATATSITAIVNQLNALALPTSVVYALESVGAGIIAALADGPLPFGDALLLVAAVGAAVVIAANWSSISSKWSSIVSVFTNAFSSIASTITSVFSEISASVPNIQSAATITGSGTTRTINGITYACTTAVSNITQQQKQHPYYVAIRDPSTDNVYFDASKPITMGLAQLIIATDNSYVGVLATSSSNAVAAAGPSPWYHPAHHNGAPGYYPHYHNSLFHQCHIWYPA